MVFITKTLIISALVLLQASGAASTTKNCYLGDASTATHTPCDGPCQTTTYNEGVSLTTVTKSCASFGCTPYSDATTTTTCCDTELCNTGTGGTGGTGSGSKHCYVGIGSAAVSVACSGQCQTDTFTVGSVTTVTKGCSLFTCTPDSSGAHKITCCDGNNCNGNAASSVTFSVISMLAALLFALF